ncbi:hypothetical protein [Posidoniimonas corsicana]|nr:hypothetical protein [Posidoniimonas corsicana]
MQTSVTDEGLKHAATLSRLRTLDLVDNRITDDGLQPLLRLSALSKLDLSATLVSDAGLSHLEGIKRLSSVSLPGAVAAGLPPLDPDLIEAREAMLAAVAVPGVVSDQGIVSLQAACPNCKITQTTVVFSGDL